MRLKNDTRFLLSQSIDLDRRGRETLTVTLKATYEIGADGQLRVAELQTPLVMAEEFHGEPEASSIITESELCPCKPTTDVFLVGAALPSRGGVTRMEVGLRVGPLHKTVVVFGERRWVSALGLRRPSEPVPIDCVPLLWENAFGGVDLSHGKESWHDAEQRNPVGRGYYAPRTKADPGFQELPSIEDPGKLLKKPGQIVTPQGFAPVGRSWLPRRDYAGTYDEAWLQDRLPILPVDFDVRYHNAADPSLQAPVYLLGGEPVEVFGCRREGALQFELPRLHPACSIRFPARREAVAMAINSVTIDTEAMQLRLLFKGELMIHGRIDHLKETACWLPEAETAT